MSSSEDSDGGGKTSKRKRSPVEIPKNLSDVQRIKIAKMMSNPDKPVSIPQPRKERTLLPPPEFNRHVMGSTAGAGSGDFHTYRHIRRRTQAREELIDKKTSEEESKEEYQRQLRINFLETESKTAKNRAKRQKQKERKKKWKENETLEDTKVSLDEVDETIIKERPDSPIPVTSTSADITMVKRESDD